MKTLTFIDSLFRKFPLLLIANTAVICFVNIINAAAIFSLIGIADLFLHPSLDNISPITSRILALLNSISIPPTLWCLLIIFLFFNFVKAVFLIFSSYLLLKTKYAVLRDIMLETFDDFLKSNWYFFSSEKQGTLINTFSREIAVIGDAFGAIATYFSALLQTLLFIVVPLYLSWQVTSIVLIATLLVTLPFFLLGKISHRLGELNTSTSNEIMKVIHEGLSSAKIILGFGNQAKAVKALEKAYDSHCKVTINSQNLSRSIPLVYYPFGLLVVTMGLFMARKVSLPLSETLVLFYSLTRIIPLLGSVTEQKSALDNFSPSYEQVTNLRRRARELKQPSGGKKFCGFTRKISIENVTFAYSKHAPVLRDINMEFPKGKMVAIVGESGVGKSTLIDLIMRFSEPSSGRITFDDISLSEFDTNSYRHRIGYVPQDSILFNMSIKNNLLWSNEAASEEEMKNACREANAEEFINNLLQGYDTLVGDRGVRLSGGQIQRIAIARAMLRNPELLILDEATSALDTYSERLIQQATERISKATTVIVVAHRLSTILNADYIYVLKSGKVVEEGNYLELMQKNGKFKNMVELQAVK